MSGLWDREGYFAKSDVTPFVVSGSRTSETEAELFSVDVDDRRVTKDAAIVGSERTRKGLEVSTKTKQKGIPHRWMRRLV